MIPRFKPSIGAGEFGAAWSARPGSVERFERDFAERFGGRDGAAFQYGRGALLALCHVLGLKDAEVVLPAYTCSVVAYAITVSGNTCRFVDCEPGGYNMDLDQLEAALTERTRMVVPTHVFGFPMDVDRLRAIVERASQRFGHRIFILQDCAHGFGTRWNGALVSAAGDASLFGLGISKVMTSIFGGMVVSNDAALVDALRQWRDSQAPATTTADAMSQRAYLGASTTALSAPLYGMVRWLQDETSLLDGFTKAYHMDGLIRLPPSAAARMSDVEAAVGLVQLQQYDAFEAKRREHAAYYRAHLSLPSDWTLPPHVEGATYSHFPMRVADRDATLRRFLRIGIQLGQLIEYSVPHLAEYGGAGESQFPHSLDASRHTINLPVHPGLSTAARERIVSAINGLSARVPTASVASW